MKEKIKDNNINKSKMVTTMSLIKLIIEAIVFIGLILAITYLLKSQNGVIASSKGGKAEQKLDTAMKTYSSEGEERNIENTLRGIEGLEITNSDEENRGI